jgi:excisionase family DNA binding protein
MTSDEPLIYRVPEVARLLGCTEAVVRQMIARRQIPSRRLGRRVVVLADELRAHMQSLERPSDDLDAPERGANGPKEVRR